MATALDSILPSTAHTADVYMSANIRVVPPDAPPPSSKFKPFVSGASDALVRALSKAHTFGMSYLGIMSALGDYWRDYFPEHETLQQLSAGATTLFSQEYNTLLKMVLSANTLSAPAVNKLNYQVAVFYKDKATYVNDEYILYPLGDWGDVEVLCSSLLDPVAVLRKGEHFDIVGNNIRFNIDLFRDSALLQNSYTTEFNGNTCVILWASNVLIDSYDLHGRFGAFLYSENEDSEVYKNILIGLQYYYASTKSVPRIEASLNILFGMSFSRTPGEVVKEITFVDAAGNQLAPDQIPVESEAGDFFYKVVTTSRIYMVPNYAELLVSVGQVLQNFQLIGRFHKVSDYLSTPEWVDGALCPYKLISQFNDPSFTSQFSPTGEFANYMPLLGIKHNSKHKYDKSVFFAGDTSYLYEDVVSGVLPATPGALQITQMSEVRKWWLANSNKMRATKFDGSVKFNADRMYNNASWVTAGVPPLNFDPVKGAEHPLTRIRLHKNSTGWQRSLYDLVNDVLKYNIVYISTKLSLSTMSAYDKKVGSLAKVVESGFPVYLYPLIDVNLSLEFLDYVVTSDTSTVDIRVAPYTDTVPATSDAWESNLVVGLHDSAAHLVTGTRTSIIVKYDGLLGFNKRIKYNAQFTYPESDLAKNQGVTICEDYVPRASDTSILRATMLALQDVAAFILDDGGLVVDIKRKT